MIDRAGSAASGRRGSRAGPRSANEMRTAASDWAERVHARLPQPQDAERREAARRPAAPGASHRRSGRCVPNDATSAGPAEARASSVVSASTRASIADSRIARRARGRRGVAVVVDQVAQAVEGREQRTGVRARRRALALEHDVQDGGHGRAPKNQSGARDRPLAADRRYRDRGHGRPTAVTLRDRRRRGGGCPTASRRPAAPSPSRRAIDRPRCRRPRPGCATGRRRRAAARPA